MGIEIRTDDSEVRILKIEVFWDGLTGMKKVLMIGSMDVYGGVGHMIFEFCRNINRDAVQFDFLYYEDLSVEEQNAVDSCHGTFYKGSDLVDAFNSFWKSAYDDGTVLGTAEIYGLQEAIIEK